MLNSIGGLSLALCVVAMIVLASRLSIEPDTFPELCYRSGGTQDAKVNVCRWNLDEHGNLR